MKTLRLLRTLGRVDLADALMAFANAVAPTREFRLVTPHDTNVIAGGPARSLYIGAGGGHVAAVNEAGQEVTFSDVAGGTVLPIETVIVKATGTTATNIIAL
jgi:hypothetical protein